MIESDYKEKEKKKIDKIRSSQKHDAHAIVSTVSKLGCLEQRVVSKNFVHDFQKFQ